MCARLDFCRNLGRLTSKKVVFCDQMPLDLSVLPLAGRALLVPSFWASLSRPLLFSPPFGSLFASPPHRLFFCGPLFLPHANRPKKHAIGRAAPGRRGGEAQGRRLHLRRRSPVLPHPVPGVRSGSGRFRCCAVLCRRAPMSADGGLVSVLSTAAPRLHAAVRSSVSRHAACPRALFCLHRVRQNKSLWAFFLCFFCHVEG